MTRAGTTLGLGMVVAATIVIADYYPRVVFASNNHSSIFVSFGWLVSAVIVLVTGLVTIFRSRQHRSD